VYRVVDRRAVSSVAFHPHARVRVEEACGFVLVDGSENHLKLAAPVIPLHYRDDPPIDGHGYAWVSPVVGGDADVPARGGDYDIGFVPFHHTVHDYAAPR
jgi:hypothetical protein